MQSFMSFLIKVSSIFLQICKYIGKTIWAFYQIALGLSLILLVWGFFQVTNFFPIFEIRALRDQNPKTTTFIEAEKERLMQEAITPKMVKGKLIPPKNSPKNIPIIWDWAPLKTIPRMLQEMALVAEDSKFYSHQGFDLEQIEYALVANHQAGKQARGASTITQQVAKNLFLNKDKELSRKAHEAILTLMLEEILTKDRILEIYLNVAQFDEGLFGIKAAAQKYYQKKMQDLTPDEMLNLVCLLPSPTHWNPLKPTNGFLQHKRLVTRNWTMYKGIKASELLENGAEDGSEANDKDSIHVNAYDSLSSALAEERWKTLRSRPMIDSSSPTDSNTADTSAAENP